MSGHTQSRAMDEWTGGSSELAPAGQGTVACIKLAIPLRFLSALARARSVPATRFWPGPGPGLGDGCACLTLRCCGLPTAGDGPFVPLLTSFSVQARLPFQPHKPLPTACLVALPPSRCRVTVCNRRDALSAVRSAFFACSFAARSLLAN